MNHDTLPLDNLPEPYDPAPNPEALAVQEQTHERITDLFCRLFSARDATIITALYFDDMTALEVSTRYRLSERQVQRIRHKALKVLRSNADIRALLSPTATQ